MKVLGHRYLRHVCPVAAVCLVAWQACSNLLQDELQPQRGVTSSCRALFTVTDVPRRHAANVSLFIQDLQGYSPPHKHSGDWRTREPDQSSITTARAVRRLLLKRDSSSGASTADYLPLAALLPSVLTRKPGGEGSAPTTTTTSRIGAAGGLLPYVPCQIATYADPASVTACFRERLRRQDSLWIFFMGDSKIRNLFSELLVRTDEEMHYSITLENKTMPFTALDLKRTKLKRNMEASAATLPGLRVSFQFGRFSQLRAPTKSAEVRQLARWAAGQEEPPHLLVLGYGTWSMINMEVLFFHEAIAALMVMHEVVVPLLTQVSRRTRVIMTTENRYKVHARLDPVHYHSVPYGDPSMDWSGAVFLYHLHRHTQLQPPGAPPDVSSTKSAKERALRDYLVPGAADGGVWWWDTLLPLSLAENSECEELFHSGLTHLPLYNSTLLKCYDENHAGTVTLGDQVTMLLNLACNSVLEEREELCCG